MKITVLALCSMVAISGALGDPTQSPNPSNGKRESASSLISSADQTAKSSAQSYRQAQLQISPQYEGLGSFASPASPQFVYAKPEGGAQYATNGYKGQFPATGQIFLPQFAFAPQGTDSSASPVHYGYAQPGQIQYALAVGPQQFDLKQSGISLAGHAGAMPYHGHPIQIAFTPINGPQYQGQILKGGGISYAPSGPQLAYLTGSPAITKSPAVAAAAAPIPIHPAPATLLAAPQPSSPYGYSIQPSIHIGPEKQVITPTVEAPYYKQLSSPSATSYATFSQQLPVGAAIKVSGPVVSHPHSVYPTPASPTYPGSKVSYRSVGHSLADPIAAYSQPGAYHYGTHLYHPSLAKFSPFFAAQKYA